MGKAALLMVMGFATALLMIGSNISKISSEAVDNYFKYQESSTAHNIAAAGMNLAASRLYRDAGWRDGFSNVSFAGGVFDTQVQVLGAESIRVVTTAEYMDETAIVAVRLHTSSFSRFGYYSNIEGDIWWITGDTVHGPMHTQDTLHISGNPVFKQKVTSKGPIVKNPSSSKPKFLGGNQTGVDVPRPSNFDRMIEAATNGGRVIAGPDSVYMEFLAGGNVKWKYSASPSWTTEPLTSFSPNGVVFVSGTNVHVSGTIDGRITLGVGGTTGSNTQGNIFLDDDLVYATNPKPGPSDDMAGLVAENNIVITDNTANNSNINIHASLFSRSGGLTAERYATRGKDGRINLLGGLQQNTRRPVGTFSGGSIVSGYLKNYLYDDRLLTSAPPFYPTTGGFEVVSWFEK